MSSLIIYSCFISSMYILIKREKNSSVFVDVSNRKLGTMLVTLCRQILYKVSLQIRFEGQHCECDYAGEEVEARSTPTKFRTDEKYACFGSQINFEISFLRPGSFQHEKYF